MSGDVRQAVRERYARSAREGGCGEASCCGPSAAAEQSRSVGYSGEQLASVPAEANLGLGCGNPTAIAALEVDSTVLDLGSGGGIDCFLAARRVGPRGRVIGVDMTPEMIDRSRVAAERGGFTNVEFRLGEIESLPVADVSVDTILSNCVINLSPDKARVFREAFRVLKPGGKLMISDIVLLESLPDGLRANLDLLARCVSGAMVKGRYLAAVEAAGFVEVAVVSQTPAAGMLSSDDPTVAAVVREAGLSPAETEAIGRAIVSLALAARKPG